MQPDNFNHPVVSNLDMKWGAVAKLCAVILLLGLVLFDLLEGGHAPRLATHSAAAVLAWMISRSRVSPWRPYQAGFLYIGMLCVLEAMRYIT